MVVEIEATAVIPQAQSGGAAAGRTVDGKEQK